MVHAAVAEAEAGEVLVLTMPEPEPVALVGELLATQALGRGVAALLVDAAVRDVDELRELGLPVWARYVRVRGAEKQAPGTIGDPVEVGGATVRQGDILMTIDPRPYEANVARAEALLEQAKTRESLAKQELDRAKKLVATQAISGEELDSRMSAVAEASSAIRGAEAALRTAKLDLEWTTVRAPISGRVGRAEITEGNLVQAGPPAASLLTTIVSLDPVYVYFDADEQAYRKNARREGTVQIGLTGETGFPHEASVDFIDNKVDRAAGTIRVRAVLRNPNAVFTPGLFARVRLAGGTHRSAAMVRDQAIGTDQDRKFVLVLKPDSTVEYRAVTLGRVADGLRVIETGLKPGENVVINGLLRVRPGMKVNATSATMLALK